MELTSIIDQSNLYIGFDAANQWLYVDWKGEYTKEDSRATCLLMLETIRAHPCPKILNDNSNVTRTNVELTEWTLWWLEEMRQAGLQFIAWVYTRVFDARQETEATVVRIERPRVATFDDLASAYVWLQQQNVHST
ncbi:hypothetical protein [Hymenobacter sp. GOD-10R]|uniref:hypothetical protein n=1 Tax=Hymenobacter sp. GOD-10R TaxID=3093922 RepID=UPI002D787C94|nr:hypothetical protein [Hymenobacter sp. GOD-10R]WRQ28266.1 hypothetical protein SD425_24675 [Hymenobacter sp. GOD-10R]